MTERNTTRVTTVYVDQQRDLEKMLVPTAHDGSQKHQKFKVQGGSKRDLDQSSAHTVAGKHRHSRLPQERGLTWRTRNAGAQRGQQVIGNEFIFFLKRKLCTLENTRSNLPQTTCGRSPTMFNVPCRPDQTWSTPNAHGFSHRSWPLAHPELAICVRQVLPPSATYSDQSALDATHQNVPRVPPGLI